MWARGAIRNLPLELWLARLHELSPTDPELVYWSAVHTAVECLQSGVTTVLDHLSLIPGFVFYLSITPRETFLLH